MEIYLIRHTTPLIDKGLIYGQMDVGLTDSFTKERDLVLKQLPLQLDAIYTSPLMRCTSLAVSIAAQHPASVCFTDPALMELNFGEWEGKTWDEVAGPDCDLWMADFVNLSPPGGESMLEMKYRISLFFKYLLRQNYQSAAIVTHGGVIRTILAHYRLIPLADSFTIPVNMGQVIKLQASSW